MKLKKPGLTANEIRALILIGLVILIVASVMIGVNIGLSRVLPGGGGFYMAWAGARAFLFDRLEPYSDTVAGRIQDLTYHHAALSQENPYTLDIPFYLLQIFFPIAFIADPATARGVWMVLCELLLLAAAVISLRMIDWEPRRFFLISFFLICLLSVYSLAAVVNGSPAVLLGFLYVAILAAWQGHRDEVAGGLLVFTLFQWEVGSLFLLFMLWRQFEEGRSRVWAGFGLTALVLLAASFLIYPGWVPPFIRAGWSTLQSGFGMNTAAFFLRLWPSYGTRIAQGFAVLLIIILGYEWSTARRADARRFLWIGCLTLAVTPMLGFRSDVSDLVVLLPGLALIFALVVERWRAGYWLASLLAIFFLAVPWAFFVRSTLYQDSLYGSLLFMFYPVFMIVGLYWVRWWVTHPPVTWADRVEQMRNPR